MKGRGALALTVLVLALGGWRWHLFIGAPRAEQSHLPTAAVTQGALVVTLPVSGAMESASETPVRCQLDGTLVDIAPDNTAVKPGDFAFQLDTKDLVNQRDDLAATLADAQEGR